MATAVGIDLRGRMYALEEIPALVLRKLAGDAGRCLGEPVTEAVITVPAYVNDSQRHVGRGQVATTT